MLALAFLPSPLLDPHDPRDPSNPARFPETGPIESEIDMPSSTTGDEVDTLLAQNDAVGEWEEDFGQLGVQRWRFPRFDGAESIGTCDREDTLKVSHTSVHTEHKNCVNFTTDPGNMYLSRAGSGPYDTDVETVAAWLDAPRSIVGAVLAIGEPGTGKTALIEAAAHHADRELVTVVCTPDHTKDSLFLRFVGEGNGECVTPGHVDGEPCASGCNKSAFVLGPIPHAVKYGQTLYTDEVMLLIDGLKPILYALADGRRYLPEGNIDGSPLEIHPDFRLVMSSNPQVRGASLPEPLASRCAGTTITVETDPEMLRDLGIDESVVAAWEALKTANLWRPQIRELRVADYWLPIDPAQAVSALVPEHCPESERRSVRDIVVGFLGGNVRPDGRLVVS